MQTGIGRAQHVFSLTLSTSNINHVQVFNKMLIELLLTVAHSDRIYELQSAIALGFCDSRGVIHLQVVRKGKESLFLLLFPFSLSWVVQQRPMKAVNMREAGRVVGHRWQMEKEEHQYKVCTGVLFTDYRNSTEFFFFNFEDSRLKSFFLLILRKVNFFRICYSIFYYCSFFFFQEKRGL
jgi:hypothetical protein